MARIPTNVFVGFLGAGKTTALLHLLAHKPSSEPWAVLVNEYGDVSIDQAILAGGHAENVSIREVAGGCVCCATAPYLPVALHLLLTEAKPQRLIVETTGLGHPGRLLDTLRNNYADRLDVRATIGLVTPEDAVNPYVHTNPVFREQIDLADVLILNKVDTAGPGQVDEFQRWADDLFPPKLLIAATQQGVIDPAWLDLGIRRGLGMAPETVPELPAALVAETAPPGRPLRKPSAGACGWIFHPDDVFNEAQLLAFLGSLSTVSRLKGVFRCAEDRIVINRAGGRTTVTPTHYQHDSRVEIFGDLDWPAIEQGLQATLQPPTQPR